MRLLTQPEVVRYDHRVMVAIELRLGLEPDTFSRYDRSPRGSDRG